MSRDLEIEEIREAVKDTVLRSYDLTQAYYAQVKPVLDELTKLCETLGLPHLFVVQTKRVLHKSQEEVAHASIAGINPAFSSTDLIRAMSCFNPEQAVSVMQSHEQAQVLMKGLMAWGALTAQETQYEPD